ncbi:MAG: phasin family protein [Alphaproteobacteria bacterium]|nr:phasin family protein [Alphaproteobacteria bacterium]
MAYLCTMLRCSTNQPSGRPRPPKGVKPVNAKTTKTAKDAFEAAETVVKAGTDAAKASYEQALQMTKEQVEKASQNFFKGYGEFASLGKENLEAFVQSSTIAVKAAEIFGKEWMGIAQTAVEQNVAAFQSLVAAKTLKEVVDLQNSWAKKAFDTAVVEGTRLSEMSVKTANDAFEPIKARVNVSVEKLFKPVAA